MNNEKRSRLSMTKKPYWAETWMITMAILSMIVISGCGGSSSPQVIPAEIILNMEPSQQDIVNDGLGKGFEPKEIMGKLIFFDKNLSEPAGQACAGCHGQAAGWTGPDSIINEHGAVYEGALKGRFGNRKPPTISYAAFIPNFHLEDSAKGIFAGGNFWDGRATGERFGSPSADQATKPFLNPLEMNNPDEDTVVTKVCSAKYAPLFKFIWGNDACDDVTLAVQYISLSIVAFERSKDVSPFNSKFDAYLDGEVALTEQERLGLELFTGKALCDNCHVVDKGPNGEHPLITNAIYGNPGTPKNPESEFYKESPDINPDGAAYIDPGLQGFLKTTHEFDQALPDAQKNDWAAYRGKFKVPTLRNVDKRSDTSFVKAYMHNGFFKSLKEVVHFYNTRDSLGPKGASGEVLSCEKIANPIPGENCWPLPEWPGTKNPDVGNLGLTEEEEDAIVAFLKTLSDQ